MTYGLWQEDIQEWVYAYECLYDVNPDVADDALIYDAEDIVWEDDGNYVYGWHRIEFNDKKYAEWYCEGERHAVVREID